MRDAEAQGNLMSMNFSCISTLSQQHRKYSLQIRDFKADSQARKDDEKSSYWNDNNKLEKT
jgi:hypothetical protein